MKNLCIALFVISFLLAASNPGYAQDETKAQRKQIIHDNQDAVDAIAMYPREVRKNIFIASGYPEIIIQLSQMQKNTNADFDKLISPLNKEEQEKIWDLTRYPDLIYDIAAEHKKSESELRDIAARYPEEIRTTAVEEGEKNYNIIVQIDRKNKEYGDQFDSILKIYPDDVNKAFADIIKLPDILEILANHLQFTVIIGDAYKKNPDKLLHKTDSLNTVLKEQNASESADWQQSLKDDPQAQKEFIDASQQYANENGYQPADYEAPLSPNVTEYSTNSYSWWYGYPSWYPYAYWNPNPYWYDWGFYYGPGRVVVVFGMPSHAFMNWYFYHSEHSYRYPELSDHYYRYYQRHEHSINNNSISHGVYGWRERNRDIITKDWDNDNAHRVDRFREFGKIETERDKYNKDHPKQQLSQRKFIRQNSKDYPISATSISKEPIKKKSTPTVGVDQNPGRNPRVAVPESLKLSNETTRQRNDLNKQQAIPIQQDSKSQPFPNNQKNNNVNVDPKSNHQVPATTSPAVEKSGNNFPIDLHNNNSQPEKSVLKPDKPVQSNPQTNSQQMNKMPQQVEKPASTSKIQPDTKEIRKATEYHQNTWQQMQPQKQSQPVKAATQRSAPVQQQRSSPATQQRSSPAPQQRSQPAQQSGGKRK